MNEARIAKFETLIEDINKTIEKPQSTHEVNTPTSFFRIITALEEAEKKVKQQNTALGLIFDYDACNEYAKIIIDKSDLKINPVGNQAIDKWKEKYYDIALLKGAKAKIEAAKLFVQYCRESQNISEGYKFIFWSLLILTVDKNNAQEYLSLICDFAKMLKITNEEFEDIIYSIKCIYNEVHEEYLFKSESIPAVLGGIFNLYKGQEIQEFVNL